MRIKLDSQIQDKWNYSRDSIRIALGGGGSVRYLSFWGVDQINQSDSYNPY